MNAVCVLKVALVMSCFVHKIISGSCTPKLEKSLLEDLRSMTMKIKRGTEEGMNQPDEKFSAFAASLTASKTLGAGEIIKFNKVWTNIDDDYNPMTGIYTAPKRGVYYFSSSVMSQYDKTLRVFLCKNNRRIVAVFTGYSDTNMATLNMVLELKKGDTVYIKQDGPQKYIYSESQSNYNMFSGYLIR
ncbi:complement C1q-like protein 3 [Mytilus trossulus]|uniref:complement C1q-like protein 3 n=1 Tax=Mytilus trossulus TaxID=6551 RepID=UPI003006CDC8